MPITFDSLATTKGRILGFFQSKLSAWDLSDKGDFGKLAATLVLTVYQWLATARRIDLDAVPTAKTSADGIAEWAANGVGISNGDNSGGVGLKKSIPASGGVAPFTGVNGTIIPANATLTYTASGAKFILTNGALTIPIGGSISGNINAVTGGTVGNIAAGTQLSIDSPPIGSDLTVTLGTGLTGGLEAETAAAGLARIQDRLRNPPKAITASDIRESVEAISSVADAFVYPHRSGTGTADVLAVTSASGAGRVVPAATIQAKLDTIRNVTAVLTGLTAVTGTGLTLRVRIAPTLGNGFDWDSSAGTWTVDTIVAANQIKLNTLAPADLKAAVDAGLKPRVQFRTTGVVLPLIARVTGYADAGGKTTLTLDTTTFPAGWIAPTVADPVYAGGGAVMPIATALLALVDSTGPSRVSGYADSHDAWEDTVRIAEMTRIALSQMTAAGVLDDVSGVFYASDLVAGTQPTINGASTNVTGADTGSPPEILFTLHVNVTP